MGKSLQIANVNNSSIEPVITISDIKNVGIGTTNPSVKLDINSTDAIQLPSGKDNQRPVPKAGMLRYNNEINKFEGYNGTKWARIGINQNLPFVGDMKYGQLENGEH